MRQETIDVLAFDELDESARATALEGMYDINVDHDWWDCLYDDAATIGVKLTGFDTGRAQKIEGQLTETVGEVCRRILQGHGKACDTHETARDFYMAKRNGAAWDEDDFLKRILEDYLIMLRNEYEHLTSEEAVIETIRANEYEFTADGKLF